MFRRRRVQQQWQEKSAGIPGAAWARSGRAMAVWTFKVERGPIVELQVVGDPESIARLEVVLEE